jgi:hypothetical protein
MRDTVKKGECSFTPLMVAEPIGAVAGDDIAGDREKK